MSSSTVEAGQNGTKQADPNPDENVYDLLDVSGSSAGEDDYENDEFEEDSDSEEFSLSASQSDAGKGKSCNKTFTADKMREIERENAILMNKILRSSNRRNQHVAKIAPRSFQQTTSYAINKKKNQMRIDWENQILLRRIQTVKPSVRYDKM